ncbi:MAG TPA: response regulator [Candidatus Polarisedimenticolia bacterium]|nr:response regulator [Candidatus Polarisedimenticolia bacterium]
MIRALIVDDEAPARRKIRELLAREGDFEVAGEASDGHEAVELIRSERPDVVFLDIQMPGLDGFGVVEAIGPASMPAVVFVTAYDEHALKAFEVHALDYLLKPFAPSRFRAMLGRLRAGGLMIRAVRIESLIEAIRRPASWLTQLLVEIKPGREVLLRLETVDLIRSERNYLRFVTASGEFLRRGTLRDLVPRLDPDRFAQINRAEVVRLEAIRELQPWFHGDYRVILKDGSTLSWSRRFRDRIRDL